MVIPNSAEPALVTFTANPSVDRTIQLPGPLERGQVQRAARVLTQAAGKGINIARVLESAGADVVAVTAAIDAGFRSLVEADAGGPRVCGVELPESVCVRVNTTVTEPDGTTTKINEAGPTLTSEHLHRAQQLLLATARRARWVAVAGSLVPGAPVEWYATLAAQACALGAKIAVDTSGAGLDGLVAALPASGVDLLKPNVDELAQLSGADPAQLESAVAREDLAPVVGAARVLRERGVREVLVSLGGAGAVLVGAEGAWWARAPKVQVRSTVGAGDSTVAGYLLAEIAGRDPVSRLVHAVRHGSAAAALPGTGVPTPNDLPDADVDVRSL